MKRIGTTLLSLIATITMMAQGWPANYGGVMLQGFYWDSYSDTRWTVLEKQVDDLAATFDLVWLPQSGKSQNSPSMGYDPLYWFTDYNSSFGNEVELRSLINTLKQKGIGTIADVVINHRGTLSTWTDFPVETYNGVTYTMTYEDICSDDEAARNGQQVGANKDTGENWDGMRDLDHTRENVQTAVKAYLKFLLGDLGYTGFRYDMVKGYAPEYTKIYNTDAQPQFSVGECWDGTSTIRKWVDGTDKTSAAFDFQFRYTVRNAANNGDWSRLAKQNDGNWPLVSRDYEGGGYRQYAVTFVENHDTERRSNAAQDPLVKDTLAANAYLIAMPGTPCVFMTHWQAYKSEIKAMIEARKAAGITNTSSYANFRSNSAYYANTVDDKLLVVVGDERQVEPNSAQWTKILAGHHYAYYLANSLETAWADKASGSYTDAFTVTLTAVSADAGAKLVYTTDGSTPSATNGKQAGSGETLTIDSDCTLTVGLLTGGAVKGIVTRSFWFTEAETVKIPDFCKVGEGETCAFFEAPPSWDKTIYCWAWTNTPADNFTSKTGTWPGAACEPIGTADNGNQVWKWTWDGTKQNNSAATQPAMVIFSSEGSPQTKDLDFQNGGYYNEYGLQGNVTTGIRSVAAPDINMQRKVYALDGRLVRIAAPGEDALGGLPKGVYIVNRKKYIKE